jgi:hypothetical protein
MKDLRALLRDADPVGHEAGLPRDTVAELRRAMLAAADTEAVRSVLWHRQLALAACLTLMVLVGLVAAHRVPPAVRDVPVEAASMAADQRTQIHFSTPGGTRIVWTLDPGFQLRETMK